MPIWHTHNIKNVGKDELYTVFLDNEEYDQDDPIHFMKRCDILVKQQKY